MKIIQTISINEEVTKTFSEIEIKAMKKGFKQVHVFNDFLKFLQDKHPEVIKEYLQ